MPRLSRSKAKYVGRARPAGFVVGRDRFARISAVEGIALTPQMRELLDRFDRERLSAMDRRAAILSRFTPA